MTRRFLVAVILASVVLAQSEPTATTYSGVRASETHDVFIAVTPNPPQVAEFLGKRASSTNYYSGFVGYFPWPDERDGPQCEFDGAFGTNVS